MENNYSGKIVECGVDEVGRGCLAGPVFAAAVILPGDFYHPKLRDSKKMTDKNRREVYQYIRENAIEVKVSQISEELIDKINILESSILAMHEAIKKLKKKPDFIIVDGNQFRTYSDGSRIIPHKCIIGGDNLYASIAAASVIAKVERDDFMKEIGEEYPQYNWAKNAGYGVPEHVQAIRENGLTPYHRKSFNIPL